MENWRIKLSQPSTKVEVEVEAELGNIAYCSLHNAVSFCSLHIAVSVLPFAY